MWGKKKVRHDKTKKPMKNPFQDKPDIVWSAEPQENFTSPELKKQIEIKLSSKHIWPFPSASDGRDSGYEERTSICKKLGYQLWQSSRISEQAQTWRLVNGIEPTTGSSDGSTSESASNSESEAQEEDEEEDEV